MEGSNLIFIVRAIVLQICQRTGVFAALIAGSHSPGLPAVSAA